MIKNIFTKLVKLADYNVSLYKMWFLFVFVQGVSRVVNFTNEKQCMKLVQECQKSYSWFYYVGKTSICGKTEYCQVEELITRLTYYEYCHLVFFALVIIKIIKYVT